MAAWHTKKIITLLNQKIRKKPCPFEIIDDETVGLLNFWKTNQPVGKDPIKIDQAISIQEQYNKTLLNRIKEVLSDYNHKTHVIIDQDGRVSIIICKWTYRQTKDQSSELEVIRNPKRKN